MTNKTNYPKSSVNIGEVVKQHVRQRDMVDEIYKIGIGRNTYFTDCYKNDLRASRIWDYSIFLKVDLFEYYSKDLRKMFPEIMRKSTIAPDIQITMKEFEIVQRENTTLREMVEIYKEKIEDLQMKLKAKVAFK